MWQVRVVSFKSQDVDGILKPLIVEGMSLIDDASRERLQRFYRKEDTLRGLIGRLLPRTILQERGVPLRSMTFCATLEGKPYMAVQGLSEPVGYNITHDSCLVAMAFASGKDLCPCPPAHRIGVDVMRLHLPNRHTFGAFVQVFKEQLTEEELSALVQTSPSDEAEGLRRFYLIWTLKEAYTKALGVGLGFDFRRIHYDVVKDVVRIDGSPPKEWQFVRFDLTTEGSSGAERYVGVAVRYLGTNDGAEVEGVVSVNPSEEWLQACNATDFLDRAVREMKGTRDIGA